MFYDAYINARREAYWNYFFIFLLSGSLWIRDDGNFYGFYIILILLSLWLFYRKDKGLVKEANEAEDKQWRAEQ